ncbi:PLDc N-terminal domain-containing protein [Nocardioides daeguensis]|uniref:Cardiolipin synthase N-terminal domain-containing protein n=1 Tax=Nocardioides daeguensis TaxID=908359 RepID=A0ABP6VGA1_9ACTN|nr:PLDc N-terminal domain-containing protein [Nocardioides daeguensis]MBV6728934.1 PLD nuclease N-terminal domain-containing protein [Nocardioides daeguensis]MCR1773455.1 PLD nuclease N-terminal domain-containing protein [Nocardioides daeguensis]
MLRLLPPLLVLILWIYCLVDVITARDDSVRNLAKTWWLLIVFFFPLAGSIAWFIAGRPVTDRPLTRQQGAAPGFPEYERRGRFAAADAEKDEEFLRKIRERAEEQRRAYERTQREQREEERRQQEGPDPV